jgi:hypothetical protein
MSDNNPQGQAPAPARGVVNWKIVLGSVSALILAITGLVAVFRPASDAGGKTGTNTGNSNCIVQDSSDVRCPQGFPPKPPDPQLTDDETAAQLRRANTQTSGPWPFMVLHTDASPAEKGLKVRNSPVLVGHQIGTANNRQTLWVECEARTGFDPERGTDRDVGDRWLEIHWPATVPGKDVRNSSVGDPVQGWVYAGYAFPNGHNGTVPACRRRQVP